MNMIEFSPYGGTDTTIDFVSDGKTISSSIKKATGFFDEDDFVNHFVTDRGTKCGSYICFLLSKLGGDVREAFNVKENPLKLFYATSPTSMKVSFGNEMCIFKMHKEGERKTFFRKGEIEDIIDYVKSTNGIFRCSMCSEEASAKKLKYEKIKSDETMYFSLSFEVDKERERKLFKLVECMKDMSIEGIERKMKPYEKGFRRIMSTEKYEVGNDESRSLLLFWEIYQPKITAVMTDSGEILIDYMKEGVCTSTSMFFKHEDTGCFICRANGIDRTTLFLNEKGEKISEMKQRAFVLDSLDEVFRTYSI